MSTVRFVYLHGDAISCPQAIPAKLKPRLEAIGYKVTLHAWDAFGAVAHEPGDILLGHAHPVPGTAFRASLSSGDWGRVVMMSPYNEDPLQVAWLNPLVARADRFVAVCGPYWAERFSRSRYAWWGDRFRPLELAVDREDFPRVKRSFGRPGQRRLLYIGRAEWPKNPPYLEALAAARPQWDWGWIGSGRKGLKGFRRHGQMDFRSESARRLVASYDFTLTVGTFDANPSTLLESMAWGLIPLCSPQSGYAAEAGIVNVPLGDLEGAVAILDGLQTTKPAQLLRLQRDNDRLLKDRFSWDRVAADLGRELRSVRPSAVAYPLRERFWTLGVSWRSPLGPVPVAWQMLVGKLKRTAKRVLGAVRPAAPPRS